MPAPLEAVCAPDERPLEWSSENGSGSGLSQPSGEPSTSGKAASLQALHRAGFRVPEFIVCTGDVRAAVEQLGFPLAVRSAATLEDGNRHSFAGQFHTALNLHSMEQAGAAAQECRDSLTSSGVAHYCRSHGINVRELRMEVIVQRMISPDVAGVAFTLNPITGMDEVVIEAHAGLADDLLAGRVAPLPCDHPLLCQHRTAIEEMARQVQRFFGAPQDVEFAVQNDTVYVLQARPITRVSFSGEAGQWTNADFRDGGVSSRVCSPLMWSLYEWIWDSTLKKCLKQFHLFDKDFVAARMFFGRPYWNLGAVKDCLARLPGYVERDFDTDMNVEIDYEGRGVVTPLTLRGSVRAVRAAAGIGKFFRHQAEFDRRFLDSGFGEIERRYEFLDADPDRHFRMLIEQDYPLTEVNYFQTIFAATLAKMDFATSFPDADYASLVAALPELRHMAPVREMDRMAAEGGIDVDALARRFRHHYRFGLDICLPRWDEDQAFIGRLGEEWEISNTRASQEQFAQAQADALRRVPWWKRGSFRRKLDRMRHFVWLREEMRDVSSRIYYLLRRAVLGIGRVRGLGDDVFFMSFREILADDRSHVEIHRGAYESYRNFRAPNEIGARYGAAQPTAGGLRGIGVSRGIVTGVAHIARTVEEAMRIEPGAILVCPFTDPGWTPVLARVAGVVTETGGMLSHAAVICREFGKPAVLGVADAIQRIPGGRRITLNGSEGSVKVEADDCKEA